MLWSLKCCSEDIILPNPREGTIATLSGKCFHPICYSNHRRVTECYAPLPSVVFFFFFFPTLVVDKVSNAQEIGPKGYVFLLQLALHPPPPTLSFYHDNLFCPSCVEYYAMLSFVSSPDSSAEMKENWFPTQTCPSLLAAKRHASQRESPLHSYIFFLNGP
jgi:hypothetical protein